MYGNEEHAQQIHGNTLAETFKTLQENGLAVRQDKCETNVPSIEYNGMIFNKKLYYIKELPFPSNVAKLKSFLDMTNYLSRSIKGFSMVSEPLRRLFKQYIDWVWTRDRAFNSM